MLLLKKIIICAIFIFASNLANAQSFDARVNRSSIPQGETFLLTLELNNARTQNTPDFAPLQTDFKIFSVSNTYKSNIINGQTTQSQQWNLVLMPYNKGKVLIPSIMLDGLTSAPIEITVGGVASNDKSAKSQNTNSKYTMSSSIDNTHPFVQEQVIYNLTILDKGGLQGQAPYFGASADWIIKTLGAPIEKVVELDGQQIRKITFQYALFAQKSGKLEIPPAIFEGYYLTKDSRQDPFARLFDDDAMLQRFAMNDVFSSRNPIYLKTDSILVDVKPALGTNTKWWLPAKDVKLTADFAEENPSFEVGKAITRNIYLRAVGVIDTQLPELNFASNNDVKQYPERPRSEMKVEDDNVVAMQKISNVYIPQKSGEIELPEISLQWFDVLDNSTKTATIPAQKIVATGKSIVEPNEKEELAPTLQIAQTKEPANIPTPDSKNLYGLIFFAFVIGIAFCFAILKLLNSRKSNSNYSKLVHSAIVKKDIKALRDNLLGWGRERFAPAQILSLGDIAQIANDVQFSNSIDSLQELLYSKNHDDFDFASFEAIFKRIVKKRIKNIGSSELLPKLYK